MGAHGHWVMTCPLFQCWTPRNPVRNNGGDGDDDDNDKYDKYDDSKSLMNVEKLKYKFFGTTVNSNTEIYDEIINSGYSCDK